MKALIFVFTFLLSIGALAQVGSPLTVETDTIALWSFDSDSGSDVFDSSTNSLDGTNYGTTHIAIPSIDPSFSLGRQVTGPNQFVDFGVTQGGSFDFQGQANLAVEAIISLSSLAENDHIIFSTDQVQLMVTGGKLGGFIRTSAGFKGVVSDNSLALNTNYRVGIHKHGSTLAISINGNISNTVEITDAIVAPSYSSARVTIGGNIFNQYFPGYIDDVRVSNTTKLDVAGPIITKLLPDTFVVSEAKPDFSFTLADNDSGVNASSVEVYLNSVLQNNLTITSTSITGKMDDSLSTTVLNEVKVVVSDNVGNTSIEVFTFSFASIGGKTEYESDASTLALWHMDDFSMSMMMDSSSNAFHGFGDPAKLNSGVGVFGLGKYFQGTGTSKVSIGSIKLPNNEFSFEGWYMPTNNSSSEEILISTGQIKVARFNNGHVRIAFDSTRSDQVFETINPILPVGEQHHLAITWDGNSKVNNLKLFIDGAIQSSFDACINCDLNPFPAVGEVGTYFAGMMDEVRFSSIVRSSFNVPTTEQKSIDFLSLTNGTSVNTEFPVFHATISSTATITPANVKVILNGVEQPATSNLVVTATTIDGSFTDAVSQGLNYLEVKFTDDNGNTKKKSQFFIYSKKSPLAYYRPDANTVGLWRFERFNPSKDSSGNGFDFETASAIETKPGVVGDGVKGDFGMTDFQIEGRSFTIEGHFKSIGTYTSQRALWYLNGSEFNHYLYLTPSNGDMNIYLNTPDFTINKTVTGLFPQDGNYHHIALVYDSTRQHSELLLLIDGEVVQALDIQRTCNFSGNLTFNVQSSTYFEKDEVRVSNIARYNFNNGSSSNQPVVTSSITDGSTVTSSQVNISSDFSSAVGISNSGNKVILNGVEETGLTFTQVGTNATLSGQLVNIINGENHMQIIARDVNGGEQSVTIKFYRFQKLAAAEYVSDADTLALLHFEETAGTVFADSSSNAFDFNFSSGWTLGSPGVFGSATTTTTSATSTISSLSGLKTYTIEVWMKGTTVSSTQTIFQLGSFHLYRNSNKALYLTTGVGNSFYSSVPQVVFDNEWHHLAVVVDESHPHSQIYFLEDGVVLDAKKVNNLNQLDFGSSTSATIGSYWLNQSFIDELRVSTKARYEFVSDQN